jgi:hypothetical protein
MSKTIAKQMYETEEDVNKTFLVKCDFKGLETVQIMTSHKMIVRMIKKIKALNVKNVYHNNLIKMIAYSKTIEEIYAKGGQEWDFLCGDVILYYCVRAILFDKPIPIIYQ